MILTIAVSDKDLQQAIRQMKWIGWLSSQNDNSMLGESCLLVCSRRASFRAGFKYLCWLTARIFREARCYVPENEHEVGWPGAANWMFSECLTHVEKHFPDDIFFLEPDGLPLVPTWWDQFQAEWDVARSTGKSFMGARVEHSTVHMTGIAVYGEEWREVAPMLIQSPDHDAWDCYAASQVVPRAHLVPLIQHVFRRSDPGWRVPHLSILDKRAVLFHQDKKGVLLPMLDAAHYHGQAADHPLFGYRESYQEAKVMRKFYRADNATKVWKSQGYKFAFDRIDSIAGTTPGVFTTEFEAEQSALDDLAANPVNGIREISVEEWERHTKKKWVKPILNTSKPLKETSPVVPILPTPSQSPATLVAEPGPTTAPGDAKAAVTEQKPLKDISEVVKTGNVKTDKPKSNRPRKT